MQHLHGSQSFIMRLLHSHHTNMQAVISFTVMHEPHRAICVKQLYWAEGVWRSTTYWNSLLLWGAEYTSMNMHKSDIRKRRRSGKEEEVYSVMMKWQKRVWSHFFFCPCSSSSSSRLEVSLRFSTSRSPVDRCAATCNLQTLCAFYAQSLKNHSRRVFSPKKLPQ